MKLLGKYFVHYITLALIQLGLILLITVAILVNGKPEYDYSLYVTHFFSVVIAKVICSACLHLMLYPEIANTM